MNLTHPSNFMHIIWRQLNYSDSSFVYPDAKFLWFGVNHKRDCVWWELVESHVRIQIRLWQEKPWPGCEWYHPTMFPVILPSTMSFATCAKRWGGKTHETVLTSISEGIISFTHNDCSSRSPINNPIRSNGLLTSRAIFSSTRFVMKTLNKGSHEIGPIRVE